MWFGRASWRSVIVTSLRTGFENIKCIILCSSRFPPPSRFPSPGPLCFHRTTRVPCIHNQSPPPRRNGARGVPAVYRQQPSSSSCASHVRFLECRDRAHLKHFSSPSRHRLACATIYARILCTLRFPFTCDCNRDTMVDGGGNAVETGLPLPWCSVQ